MLDNLGDLMTLIRLVEIELLDLKSAIDGDDEEARNNAGEIIVHVDCLATKLKKMYEDNWNAEGSYPEYNDFISEIKSHEPFSSCSKS